VARRIVDAALQMGRYTFRTYMVLDEIARELDDVGRDDEFCDEVETRFTSLLENGEVPACEQG
jgi:hypothetical protein